MYYFKTDSYIGKYRVKFPIKEGDYAQTYRVVDQNNKIFFLKLFINSKLSSFQYTKNNTILEVEITKTINHQHITKYVDDGCVDVEGQRMCFLVYDFISGETIAQKIAREGELSIFEAKTITKNVLEGLKYLHSRENPIIHNDINVQNVMLDLSHNKTFAKIIDLGHCCYYLGDRGNFSKMGLSVFSTAPEADFGLYSIQSDLFSVGVMLYTMIFGMPPWLVDLSEMEDEAKEEVIRKERSNPLKIPNTNKVFELDKQLLNILKKSTSNRIEDRFQTVDEFIKALDGDLIVEVEQSSKTIAKQSVDQKDEKLSNLSSKQGNGFKDVVGMQDLKDILQLSVIDCLKNPEKYKKFKLDLPNGMLLYGPPGCGKTFFAEKFAEETGYNFQKVISSDIASIYVHGTQQQIAKIFDEARKNAPTILYFDEINTMVPSRESDDLRNGEQGEVNEFLSQLDNCGQKGVFVIASTNYPHQIDKAVLRAGRLEKHFYIPLPDFEARKGLFKMYLTGRPTSLEIDYDELAGLTNNYVSSTIKLIVDDASLITIKENEEEIYMDALKKAISKAKPLSLEDIEEYAKIKENFDGSTINKTNRKKIGF
ncbi:MAG: AAA family ATPase [Bacteroidales bacterium]|nr:AAA family ATPase [Bacteroidales bacterium]